MKTMKLVTMLFLAIGITLTSCEKEGPIGPAGPAGAQGSDGAAGPAGPEGAQGVEGNANVQTFTFDTSALTGTNFQLAFAALTQDVLDNDVILNYIQRGTSQRYYPIPGISIGESFEVELRPGTMAIYSYVRTTGAAYDMAVGRYTLVKSIIIESSSTTAGKSTEKDVLSKLKAAGVDVNDYYQVADHFGLDY